MERADALVVAAVHVGFGAGYTMMLEDEDDFDVRPQGQRASEKRPRVSPCRALHTRVSSSGTLR
jgi:hypothetical protein